MTVCVCGFKYVMYPDMKLTIHVLYIFDAFSLYRLEALALIVVAVISAATGSPTNTVSTHCFSHVYLVLCNTVRANMGMLHMPAVHTCMQ